MYAVAYVQDVTETAFFTRTACTDNTNTQLLLPRRCATCINFYRRCSFADCVSGKQSGSQRPQGVVIKCYTSRYPSNQTGSCPSLASPTNSINTTSLALTIRVNYVAVNGGKPLQRRRRAVQAVAEHAHQPAARRATRTCVKVEQLRVEQHGRVIMPDTILLHGLLAGLGEGGDRRALSRPRPS